MGLVREEDDGTLRWLTGPFLDSYMRGYKEGKILGTAECIADGYSSVEDGAKELGITKHRMRKAVHKILVKRRREEDIVSRIMNDGRNVADVAEEFGISTMKVKEIIDEFIKEMIDEFVEEEEAAMQERKRIVRKFLEEGFDVQEIMKYTDLSEEEILRIGEQE